MSMMTVHHVHVLHDPSPQTIEHILSAILHCEHHRVAHALGTYIIVTWGISVSSLPARSSCPRYVHHCYRCPSHSQVRFPSPNRIYWAPRKSRARLVPRAHQSQAGCIRIRRTTNVAYLSPFHCLSRDRVFRITRNGETMVPFSLHSKPVLGLLRHA